jgi:hypothetical protein
MYTSWLRVWLGKGFKLSLELGFRLEVKLGVDLESLVEIGLGPSFRYGWG